MSKQLRLALILGVATAISIFISACIGDPTSSPTSTETTPVVKPPSTFNCVTGSVTAAGDATLQPLISAVAKSYSTKCSGANVIIKVNTSKQSLADVENNTIQIGNSDIFANGTTQNDLVDHQVAVVVFTLIVNSNVSGLKQLTTDQIKSIYTGATTNWSQVGGPDLPIAVVGHTQSSGIRKTFEKYVLGTTETVSGPPNLITDSTETTIQNVKLTSGAISYTVLGAAKSSGLTMLGIDNNAPTANAVEHNTYKFWAFEHMYTKGQAAGLTKALIDYMASDFAKQTVSDMHFVAIAEMLPISIASHQQH